MSFLAAQNTAQVLVQKIPLEISFPSGDSRLKISFRFISSLFLIPLAQSQQISSFDFLETNMFDCFRRIAPSSAGLANDVIPFLARDANENLASETSRPLATSSLAHLLRGSNCRIPCHFEAAPLKRLDTRIRSPKYHSSQSKLLSIL